MQSVRGELVDGGRGFQVGGIFDVIFGPTHDVSMANLKTSLTTFVRALNKLFTKDPSLREKNRDFIAHVKALAHNLSQAQYEYEQDQRLYRDRMPQAVSRTPAQWELDVKKLFQTFQNIGKMATKRGINPETHIPKYPTSLAEDIEKGIKDVTQPKIPSWVKWAVVGGIGIYAVKTIADMKKASRPRRVPTPP